MLTVREVAELLQKSHFSIYRMAQRRQIPSLMIGGTRYFDPSVLALWLSKKNRRPPRRETPEDCMNPGFG